MSTLTARVRGMAVYARARIGRGTSAQGFYAQRLRFGDLAFDIGANQGRHTAAMLKRGARVIALEPQADVARRLERNLPGATVLALGVSDQRGNATMITCSSNDELATLSPASLDDPFHAKVEWDGEETIHLTTLDDLIAEFGLPAFIKIDTEGLEDKVLAGLSQPVEQFLFEVHSGMPDVAARAFERLTDLGTYEYQLTRGESFGETWLFSSPLRTEAILANLPELGDVYARLISVDSLHRQYC